MRCLLLDTNILIAAMKGVERVREKLEATPLSEIVLSPVVLGELALDVEKSLHREKNAARLARVVDGLHVVALDAATSRYYGVVRAELGRQGVPIGANDCWIAAQALAFRAVLVTDNVGEFSRVSGLTVENWLA
ncbi:MAG TPA: VapC toxin family PIN domain ribonuclease [Candidatus Accumulibacter sp.]|nr:VapC toxin family PIN domain ribonuclease [Accumulibacter sp.]